MNNSPSLTRVSRQERKQSRGTIIGALKGIRAKDKRMLGAQYLEFP